MAVHKTSSGIWSCQYRVPGRTSPVKEYFGPGSAGCKAAEIRDAEIKLQKAKGEKIVLSRDPGAVYLDRLAQLYLDDARTRGTSDRWRKEFSHILNVSILPALAHKPVDLLDYADIMRMVDGWPTSRSTNTINRYLGYLRAVFKFGIEQELIRKNPMAKWRKAREQKRRVLLTVDDLRRILEHSEPHLAWAIEIEWELGTRPGATELLALKWSDIDVESRTIHVPGTKTEGAARNMPITPAFLARLMEMQHHAQSDHLVEFRGRPIKKFRRAFQTACRRAGITYNVRMYDIRHLFASVKLAGGADLMAVSRLLGHTDVVTTQRAYYHLMRGEMEKAVQIGPEIRQNKAGKVISLVGTKVGTNKSK